MNLKFETEQSLKSWRGSLNPEQNRAVEHINGPLLIIAGAGSGKTRVLTNRIANLIENGVAPWNILALTFTNKSARELRDRIAKIISPEKAEKIWAGTFHSIFARILRQEAAHLGYDQYFSIWDADDQLSAIRKIMTRLEINSQQYSAQAVRSRISSLKTQMTSPHEFSLQDHRPFDRQVSKVYSEYSSDIKANNSMDFDDLLSNTVKLLALPGDILSTYQNKFKYILVDEYQDTNRVQYLILKELAKAHRNICVVGDDAQSIYRWRGADVSNILDFEKDYPTAKIIKLEQNYRSTKNILGAADSVIKYNQNQLEKTLWTDNPEGDKISVFESPDDRAESTKIVTLLKNQLKDADSLNDFAVLYRTNAQSLALENAMRLANIPYIVVGGISFFKRKEIKDTLAYLRLLVNSSDGESLLRAVNEPPRGLGKTSLEHIQNYGRTNGISLFESFKNSDKNNNLQKRAIKSAQKFTDLISEYKEKIENENEFYVIKDFIDESGIIDMYEDIGTEDAADRAENIKQLLTDLSLFMQNFPELGLSAYLEQTALATDYDEKDLSKDRVTLMTLHSAKGLEFPNVFICGLEQGLFPLSKSEYDKDEEEEERRLLYVGVTRAMKKLTLTFAKRRLRFGELQYQMPSLFLKEISSEYLIYPEKVQSSRPRTSVSLPSYLSAKAKSVSSGSLKNRFSGIQKNEFDQSDEQEESYSQIPEEDSELKVGDMVSHSQFGRGKISGLKGEGTRRQAVVRFDSVGRKMLMLKYAKLRLIKNS
jgi:ATP-dependent DNA helicase UvrD/PcrA